MRLLAGRWARRLCRTHNGASASTDGGARAMLYRSKISDVVLERGISGLEDEEVVVGLEQMADAIVRAQVFGDGDGRQRFPRLRR